MDNELKRDTKNAVISGVLSGFAKKYKMDVSVVRLLFVLLTLVSLGIGGLILYAIGAMIIPEMEYNEDKKEDDGFSKYDDNF